MSHRNAPLTETGRLRLARCIVEDGWPVRRAAERFQVSQTNAAGGPYATASPGRREWPTGPAARTIAGAGCPCGRNRSASV